MGLLVCTPIILSQVICFIFPGLTVREKKFILPLILISFTLFNLSINFSYSILIPAALKFFIQYSESVIEPLWSFDQYLDFTLLIFYSTSLAFQIPIFQLILGLTGVLSRSVGIKRDLRVSKMETYANYYYLNFIYLKYKKYIIKV